MRKMAFENILGKEEIAGNQYLFNFTVFYPLKDKHYILCNILIWSSQKFCHVVKSNFSMVSVIDFYITQARVLMILGKKALQNNLER